MTYIQVAAEGNNIFRVHSVHINQILCRISKSGCCYAMGDMLEKVSRHAAAMLKQILEGFAIVNQIL